MRWLVLVVLASVANAEPRFERFCTRTPDGRTQRGLDCYQPAFFEFAPTGAQGMGVECAGTTPTGAKGEVLTFTRATAATCTKGTNGLRTTNIANGDLVALTSGQPRVEYDADGVLGLLVEGARTNVMLRSEELTNAAWVASGSPIRTADTDTAPDGTLTADTIEDDNGGATEGVFQQAANVSTGGWTSSCYLKAGTLTSARVTMATDGTGTTTCTFTGLVTTSWTRGVCTTTVGGSPTYKEMAIYPGSGAGDTGTIKVWGCGAEAGAFASSYIPTTSAAVTRNAEVASFPGAGWAVSPVSFASTITTLWTGTTTAADMFTGNVASNSGWAFGWTGGTLRSQPCTAGSCATLDVAQGPTTQVASRWAVSYSGTATTLLKDGAVIAGPTAKTAPNSPWATNTTFGAGTNWGALNGIVSRMCLDPSPTRCR